ncbi:MAG TPA: TIGR03936 family radical SAM-associated protein, partial [Candidatus Syntrophosphaera thermopropionivorans]|nr:TIGR03936 family radical SAM-associated protein [Candidatus Syntrophosphaera thermopropionivorans]
LFRLVSKAPLETVFTQGFSPHPKISLCPPLPLGVESICEYFDISFYSPYSEEDIINALSLENIPGYKINKVERLLLKPKQPVAEWISILISDEFYPHINSALSSFDKEISHLFTKIKGNKSTTYDLKKIILKTSWKDQQLYLLKSLESPALYDILADLFRLDKTILYKFSLCRNGWTFL